MRSLNPMLSQLQFTLIEPNDSDTANNPSQRQIRRAFDFWKTATISKRRVPLNLRTFSASERYSSSSAFNSRHDCPPTSRILLSRHFSTIFGFPSPFPELAISWGPRQSSRIRQMQSFKGSSQERLTEFKNICITNYSAFSLGHEKSTERYPQ